MNTVKDILQEMSDFVPSIGKEKTVLEASKEMNKQRVGALVVTEGDNVVGIFTERDIVNRVVAPEHDPAKVLVGEVMTAPVACCKPSTTIDECRAVMTSKHIRHLPVVDGGKLVGIVAGRFLMALEVAKHQETIEYLNQYIYGPHVPHEH